MKLLLLSSAVALSVGQLVCNKDFVLSQNVCEPRPIVGGWCNSALPCGAGASCGADYKCKDDEAAANCAKNADCAAAGTYCSLHHGTCFARPAAQSFCTPQSGCATGVCKSGVCAVSAPINTKSVEDAGKAANAATLLKANITSVTAVVVNPGQPIVAVELVNFDPATAFVIARASVVATGALTTLQQKKVGDEHCKSFGTSLKVPVGVVRCDTVLGAAGGTVNYHINVRASVAMRKDTTVIGSAQCRDYCFDSLVTPLTKLPAAANPVLSCCATGFACCPNADMSATACCNADLFEVCDGAGKCVVTTNEPTAAATNEPTAAATNEPTAAATNEPTAAATNEPTAAATNEPTAAATNEPTAAATNEPTAAATNEPTAAATNEPTAAVTNEPTAAATNEPTELPCGSRNNPCPVATSEPTVAATSEPTGFAADGSIATPEPTAPCGSRNNPCQ